jgi:hypothetical protein
VVASVVSEIDREGRGSGYRVIYENAVMFGFQALGNQISKVVANYLARKYGMTIADTFSKPGSLAEALEGTLGAGGLLIERRIVKSIYLQLSSPLGESDIHLRTRQDFERYVIESQALPQKARPKAKSDLNR